MELVYQTAGEFNEKFEQRNLTIFTKNAKKNRLLSWQTEGGYGACWKTFITMSQKYALEGTRVYVELDKKRRRSRIFY